MFGRFCLYSKPLTSIHSYMEMVDFAAKHGISQLEPLNEMEFSTPDIEFAQKLKKYADEKGVVFPCVSAGINLVGDDYTAVLEDAKKYIKMTAILGSPYFHHTIALEFQNPQIIKDNMELYYQRGIQAVQELYDYAQQFNVKTIYEDQGFLFNGCRGFQRFLNDIKRDVGVVADFGNIHFVDETIESFIPAFADRIVHVHVKDYFITSPDTREKHADEYLSYGGNYLKDCPIGYGSVPIQKAFRLLQNINYSGSISLECPAFGLNEEETFFENVRAIEMHI